MSSEDRELRRRRMTSTFFHHMSVGSAIKRSSGSSVLEEIRRETMKLRENENVVCREWLFCMVEFMLAFSWKCAGARKQLEENFAMRGITPREDTMNTLFYLGMVSFTNPIVGQLADSLSGYYFMALLNITLQFALASLYFACDIIDASSSEDVYATLYSDVYLWLFFPLKSLGFVRYVYAMDQVSERKGSTYALHYTFLFNLFSVGGDFFYYAIAEDAETTTSLLSTLAFFFNGAVLFYYAYMLRPLRQVKVPLPPCASIKVWGVPVKVLWNMWKFRLNYANTRKLLNFNNIGYNEAQIARTRLIIHLFLMIIPTTGFLMFAVYHTIILKEFFDVLKVTGPNVSSWMKWLRPTSTLVVIICVEYIVIPLLKLCKFNINFLRRFVLGYIALLMAMAMAAAVTITAEKITIRPGSGTFRVYNTMDSYFLLKSMQPDYTHLNVTVMGQKALHADFETTEQNLFKVAVTFTNHPNNGSRGTQTEYTQMFSVIPKQFIQYVAIAPSSIIRVPGVIPVMEGPPGQNDIGKPRCFIVSLIRDQIRTIHVINDRTEIKNEFEIEPGKMEFFQVEEGSYTLVYKSSAEQKTTLLLETGALYGIYLYPGLHEYKIGVDKIIPENTVSGWWGLAVIVPMGFARVLGKVSLDAFVYSTAPEGSKGLAYGFYFFCIHFAAWFLFVGFLTWHHFITPSIIMYYGIIALFSFFVCIILLMKYGEHYHM